MPPQTIKLTINDTDITALLVDGLSLSDSDETGAAMEVSLRIDDPALATLDLRGEVVLDALHDGQWHRVFTGYVLEALPGSGYTLHCKGTQQLLEEARIGGAFGRDILIPEIVYYLVAMGAPHAASREHIYLGHQHSLADAEWIFQTRRYVFVAPVPAFRTAGRTLEIAGATFYEAQELRTADDERIDGSGNARDVEGWRLGGTRVRFFVHASGFLDAFEKGQDRLRKLLDVVSFGANFATPAYGSKEAFQHHTFQRDRTLTDVSETAWAYVRDTYPLKPDRYWLRWFAPHRLKEPFSVTERDPLLALYGVFDGIVGDSREEMNASERSIMNALHALRKARQAESTLDAAGHLSECQEFLVANYKAPHEIGQDQREKLKDVTESTLRQLYSEIEPSVLEYYIGRLNAAVDGINNPSLWNKWERFCDEHKVPLVSSDAQILKRLRKERNHNVHGKDAKVDRDDIYRAATIMEKAIIARALRIRN